MYPDENWDDKRIDVIGQNGNDGLHYKENEMSEKDDVKNKDDNLDYEDEDNNEDMNYNYSSGVVITDINIPFRDLVLFFIRLSLASIPAGVVILCLYFLFTIGIGLIGLGTILSF